MEKPYRLDTFTLGPWATSCYLVSDDGAATLVDAGFDPEPVLDAIAQRGLTLMQVVLTHAHIDHIAGLPAVRRRWPDVPILIHPAEVAFVTDPGLNLSAYLAEPFAGPEPTGTLDHGDTVVMGGTDWQVRHTPGHSPGGITLVHTGDGPVAHARGSESPHPGPGGAGSVSDRFRHTAIVGDTLFAGSIGRTDFPTSDPDTLMRSIREQLLTLPDDTRVLPGHGPETTINAEDKNNPFLR